MACGGGGIFGGVLPRRSIISQCIVMIAKMVCDGNDTVALMRAGKDSTINSIS